MKNAKKKIKPGSIILNGVSLNNLKQISCKFPHGVLSAVVGPSGAGKSSLLSGVLAAEGERRQAIFQSGLSVPADPRRGEISGLPIVASRRKISFRNSVSVASLIQVDTCLERIFEVFATPSCRECGAELHPITADIIASRLEKLDSGVAIEVLGGVELSSWSHGVLLEHGISRGIADGVEYELEDLAVGDRVQILFDSFFNNKDAGKRLNESLEIVRSLGKIVTSREVKLTSKGSVGSEHYQLDLPLVCSKCETSVLEIAQATPSISGVSLEQLYKWRLSEVKRWTQELEGLVDLLVSAEYAQFEKIIDRAIELGLGHLELNRPHTAISHGELERLLYLSSVSSELTGALLILEEPSQGLHETDLARLLSAFREEVSRGNTIIYSEHNPELIRASDTVLELGPGGGAQGGEVCFEGTTAEFLNSQSATAVAMREAAKIDPLGKLSVTSLIQPQTGMFSVFGAERNNLDVPEIRFPFGKLSVVCGPSGSGKTSLVIGELASRARNFLKQGGEEESFGLTGFSQISSLIVLEGSSRHVLNRSVVGNMLGALPLLRELYSETIAARAQGMTAKNFSFSSRTGWCPNCLGRGKVNREVGEGPTEWCVVCSGTRVTHRASDIVFKGLSFGELCRRTVAELYELFSFHPKLRKIFQATVQLGLGYLTLLHSVGELSGGEQQRMRLAMRIMDIRPRSLVLLDEPARGLHLNETETLMRCLKELTASGVSVIAVEHSLMVRAHADYLVELGPGAGDEGGRIVRSGWLA